MCYGLFLCLNYGIKIVKFKMEYKVSVIIPCFNEEDNLGICLDSVFAVNYPSHLFEVIVVDNGSNDRTREIARQYNTILLRDDNKRVSGLRNLGAASASGHILAFVDADCIVSKNWLLNAKKYFDSGNIIVWGSPPTIPENATWVQKTWYLVRQKKHRIEEVDWLESMNLFVKEKDFNEVKGFNEVLETAEDVDFCYRIAKKGKIISDEDIKVIHTGEAKDIKMFIKKEIWRGISNLSGIKSHGLALNEIPSLLVPIYFGLFMPILIALSLIFRSPLFFFLLGFVYLLPSIAVFIKIFIKIKKFRKELFFLIFLIQVYFFSRSVSLFKFSSGNDTTQNIDIRLYGYDKGQDGN